MKFNEGISNMISWKSLETGLYYDFFIKALINKPFAINECHKLENQMIKQFLNLVMFERFVFCSCITY